MTPRHLAAEGRDLRRRVTADRTLAVATSMNRQSILRPDNSHSPQMLSPAGERPYWEALPFWVLTVPTRVSFSARMLGA